MVMQDITIGGAWGTSGQEGSMYISLQLPMYLELCLQSMLKVKNNNKKGFSSSTGKVLSLKDRLLPDI